MEDVGTYKKRCRDNSDESQEEAKRLRADLLLDILDDDADSGYRDPAAEDIATVLKMLEEELNVPQAWTPISDYQTSDPSQPDLGYLLEASDDELGLPPATISSSSSDRVDVPVIDEVPEAFGFDQRWGFDDEISGFCGGGIDLGISTDDGLAFDGGIFDHPDVPYGASDFSWRKESLSAI